MPSLKEIRSRITSVTSTKKITSAMKMVSAAKLKKAQDSIFRIRPYSTKLFDMVSNLAADKEIVQNIPLAKTPVKLSNVTLVIFTANGSLCGTFNANAIKLAEKIMAEYKTSNAGIGVNLIVLGRHGHEHFVKKGINVSGPYRSLVDKPNREVLSVLADGLISSFSLEKTQRVELIYNKFISAGIQQPCRELILPFTAKVNENSKFMPKYILEPDMAGLLEEIIPQAIKVKLFSALLESVASEHGARTTAMHIATENATDLIKQLSLQYNKARQAAITNEISEITTGAEALKN
ncbi:MAG TPA: ATP synthase F1 subunit gamma [Williamwhitmania sp.]|nr:ATP synthase F1 subunit gamma [Williamwhitmania sp.]